MKASLNVQTRSNPDAPLTVRRGAEAVISIDDMKISIESKTRKGDAREKSLINVAADELMWSGDADSLISALKTIQNMPNGVTSWAETHFLIVEFLFTIMSKPSKEIPQPLFELQEEQGSTAVMSLAERLTNKFERLHRNNAWENGDWYETVMQFVDDSVNSDDTINGVG